MKYILGQWADNELKSTFEFILVPLSLQFDTNASLQLLPSQHLHTMAYTLVYSVHNKSTKRRESKAEIQIDNSEKVKAGGKT